MWSRKEKVLVRNGVIGLEVASIILRSRLLLMISRRIGLFLERSKSCNPHFSMGMDWLVAPILGDWPFVLIGLSWGEEHHSGW